MPLEAPHGRDRRLALRDSPIRVYPAILRLDTSPLFITASQIREVEKREEHRCNDESNDHGEKDDNDRLDHCSKALDREVELLLIGAGDAVEDLLELTALLAHGHHVADHGREDLRLADRRRDVRAFHDPRVDVVDDLRQPRVVDDERDDLERIERGEPALEKGREGEREARDRLLREELPEKRHAQEETV